MPRFLLLLCASLLVAGCDSLPSVSDRFSPVEPQTRVFGGSRQMVFQAAQQALKRMDFTQTKAALTQGIIEGRSEIQGEDAFREVRQYSIEIRLNNIDDTHVEVAVVLREQVEGDLRKGASNQALRSHGLYETYFTLLGEALREGAPAGGSSR